LGNVGYPSFCMEGYQGRGNGLSTEEQGDFHMTPGWENTHGITILWTYFFEGLRIFPVYLIEYFNTKPLLFYFTLTWKTSVPREEFPWLKILTVATLRN